MNFTIYKNNKLINFEIIGSNNKLTNEVQLKNKNRFIYDIFLDGKKRLLSCGRSCNEAIVSGKLNFTSVV